MRFYNWYWRLTLLSVGFQTKVNNFAHSGWSYVGELMLYDLILTFIYFNCDATYSCGTLEIVQPHIILYDPEIWLWLQQYLFSRNFPTANLFMIVL